MGSVVPSEVTVKVLISPRDKLSDGINTNALSNVT